MNSVEAKQKLHRKIAKRTFYLSRLAKQLCEFENLELTTKIFCTPYIMDSYNSDLTRRSEELCRAVQRRLDIQ